MLASPYMSDSKTAATRWSGRTRRGTALRPKSSFCSPIGPEVWLDGPPRAVLAAPRLCDSDNATLCRPDRPPQPQPAARRGSESEVLIAVGSECIVAIAPTQQRHSRDRPGPRRSQSWRAIVTTGHEPVMPLPREESPSHARRTAASPRLRGSPAARTGRRPPRIALRGRQWCSVSAPALLGHDRFQSPAATEHLIDLPRQVQSGQCGSGARAAPARPVPPALRAEHRGSG